MERRKPVIGRETSRDRQRDQQLQGMGSAAGSMGSDLECALLESTHLTLGTSFLLLENENNRTCSASFIATLWDRAR